MARRYATHSAGATFGRNVPTFLVAAAMVGAVDAAAAVWPQLAYSERGNYQSPLTGTVVNATLRWQFAMPPGQFLRAAFSAIGADGTVYVAGGYPSRAFALNGSTGVAVWNVTMPTARGMVGSVAVGPDGDVYVGGEGVLIRLNATTGAVVWSLPSPDSVESIGVVVRDNGLLVMGAGPHSGYTWAFNVTANATAWTISGTACGVPSFAPNGNLYALGVDPSAVYALNAAGAVQWRFSTNPSWPGLTSPSVFTSPASFGPDGTAYMASSNGVVYAVNPYGSVNWYFSPANYSEFVETPAGSLDVFYAPVSVSAANWLVYVPSYHGTLYALDAVTGALRWSTAVGQGASVAASVDGAGNVFVCGGDGIMRGLDGLTGAVFWSQVSSPLTLNMPAAVNGDGSVVFTGINGVVFAVGGAPP
jgi:outer membrane protein assembly factor BamB